METPEISRKNDVIKGLVVITGILVIVAAVTLANKKTMAAAGNLMSGNTSGYKDGTYTATGDYESPTQAEQITITVTLKKGVITDTSATNDAPDKVGQKFQNQFISGYKQQVVGKKVNEVNLSRVSGSSLTPAGFNDALSKIKTQAHV